MVEFNVGKLKVPNQAIRQLLGNRVRGSRGKVAKAITVPMASMYVNWLTAVVGELA